MAIQVCRGKRVEVGGREVSESLLVILPVSFQLPQSYWPGIYIPLPTFFITDFHSHEIQC